ncbi:MAG: M48 family metalloprotease [Methyloversatilis sp.]|uniref:Peptidase M48 Ste24p n=2 Tax=Methyloversatilis universalis TaxID=378211 RepID=F5RI73_METUF|nr:M48 family metalloprotease [Methyloversatilis universalis]EGK70055.1 Peptidase M48 Ste24p [Methyloversatilis universalis FAM5]MCP4635173.1 M48 family metalloprotease [Methyloversatilis sp.]
MSHDRFFRREMTRRDFLWLSGIAGAAVTLPQLTGCATDPITGQQVLVGMSEQDELGIDRKHSPQQFSADYGAVQDPELNRYVNEVERSLAKNTHRPDVPYNARVVNANYINAYTFPGGSMACTRGILLDMDSEDELAALLGHETGHVNARHSAKQAGRGMIAQAGAMAVNVAVAMSDYRGAAPLANIASQVGASALLAGYSRNDERQADALGLDYMTRAGYNPDGMVNLMDMLRSQHKEKPSLLQTMFSSHPMSDERYDTAQREATDAYGSYRGKALSRERYMDHTASLRRLAPAIKAQQEGESLMAKKSLDEAESRFDKALKVAPDDYCGNVLMGKCLLAQKEYANADRHFSRASEIYPGEGQAIYQRGVSKLALGRGPEALAAFNAYDQVLPGNATTLFLKGVAYETMQDKRAASQHYAAYIRSGQKDAQAQFAFQRLQAWGMVK